MWLRPGCGEPDLERAWSVELDRFAGNHRGTLEELKRLLTALGDGTPRPVRGLLEVYSGPRRRPMLLSVMWLAKLGVLDWRAPPSPFTPRA